MQDRVKHNAGKPRPVQLAVKRRVLLVKIEQADEELVRRGGFALFPFALPAR